MEHLDRGWPDKSGLMCVTEDGENANGALDGSNNSKTFNMEINKEPVKTLLFQE